MPSGKIHARATSVAPVSSLILVAANVPWSCVVAYIAGNLTGLLVTPDLDVDRGSLSKKFIRDLAGSVWSAVWYPYAVAVPHRSWISHFPVVSTLIRIAYLVFWLVFITGVVGRVRQVLSGQDMIHLLVWYFAGLAVVDTLHIIMDFLSGER